MKYVITTDGLIYLFSNGDRHDAVAKSLKVRVLSAGFVRVSDDGGVDCWGESISLDIKSRGDEDAEIIGRHLKGFL